MGDADLSKFEVACNGESVAVSARLYTPEAVDQVIACLSAYRGILRTPTTPAAEEEK